MKIDRPIAIALILFVILLLAFFLVVPEYNTFTKLQTELGEKKAEYNAEFDYYAAITKTYFDLQSRKDDISKIDDSLPQDPGLGKIIYLLERTALENGMMIKDLFLSKASSSSSSSSDQTNAGNNVKDIVFSTDLLGSYSSLEKFMISLEKSSRLFEITSISFGNNSQGKSGADQSQFQTDQAYSFNLQIKTHSY